MKEKEDFKVVENSTNELQMRIEEKYRDLSKGQKRVAEYVLDNYDKAVFLTAARLGEVVGVSESTVVRFATQLGYKGYPEFQKALEELVRNRLNSIQRMKVTYGRISQSQILETVLQSDIEKIKQTLNGIDHSAFNQAIDTILNALSGLVEKSNNVVFSAVMYVVQSLLTLLVPSSSGLAALSMPIMAPLCDLHGVNPEAAVTALQYGNQLTNLMSPVAGTTVAGLAICKISFGQWWKTIWKMFLIMAVIAIVFCTISAGL